MQVVRLQTFDLNFTRIKVLVTYMGLRENMYFLIFVYYANIKVFHFIYCSLFFIYLNVSFLLACDLCFA